MRYGGYLERGLFIIGPSDRFEVTQTLNCFKPPLLAEV